MARRQGQIDERKREAILDAAIAAPARLMGLTDRLGKLAPGYAADINLLSPATLALEAVLVDGRPLAGATALAR